MSEKTLGQIAYEAYNRAKGGLTYDGKPIPPWDDLVKPTGEPPGTVPPAGSAVQSAWEVAADAAVQATVDRWEAFTPLGVALNKAQHRHGKSREQALAVTKLQEAEMWLARIPVQSP